MYFPQSETEVGKGSCALGQKIEIKSFINI